MDNNALRPRGLGQRHLVVLLANIGLAIVYGLRSNLSVALVAMVNETVVPQVNETDLDDSCPIPVVANNSSPSSTPQGEFAWSREVQGLILSSFFWGYLVPQLPAGFLSQRVGGKWIFAAGVAWTAVLTLLTPLAARLHPYCLVTLRVLEGLGEGVTYPSLTTLLGFWVPQSESSFLFAFAFSGGQLGTILGQLVAGPLCASAWGWPSVFYLTGVAALLWLLPWCFLVTDHPSEQRFISAEETLYIESSAADSKREPKPFRRLPWRKILTDRAVWAFTFCTFVNSWKFYTLLTCLPQFLKDVLHFDITTNGFISTLPYVGNFIFQFVASWLADWVIRRHMLSRTITRKVFTTIGLGSITVFIIAAVYTGCNAAATVSMLVIMLTIGAFDLGGFSPNPLDLSPEYCGVLLGLANTLGITAGIIAPIITDEITKRHTRSEWEIVFFITAGIAAAGVLVFLIFGSGERRFWDEEEEEERATLPQRAESVNSDQPQIA